MIKLAIVLALKILKHNLKNQNSLAFNKGFQMWKFVSIIAFLSILIGNSYTMDRNQNIFKVRVNQVVRVNLELISGTGYDWFVEGNPNVFIKSYVIDNNKNNLLGRKVIKVFEVQALKTGKFNLIFILKRPWENKIEKKVVYFMEVVR